MFLPDLWPAYYSKAKGCEVWDLEGQRYYDFAQMGVGSCILGYADEDVNRAVIDTIQKGSMCSLNCPEEVELAKRLVSLHPWAHMVRFARTGGEACAIAIRIARRFTGKDKVAFCGYHGWHDWYLSSNLGDQSNLDGQLLPGLDPKGVTRTLKNTSFPFGYNNLKELEKIIYDNPGEIGAIIMEPVRNHNPQKGFLEGARKVADKIGAVFIFDEVTSGFRVNLGGIHLTYDVTPDMAVFGKALGNGFPISAIVGKREVMDAAQESFISSTFWTERIGFVAALVTLSKMREKRVQKKLVQYGKEINQGWIDAARASDLKITISGIQPLTHISFNHPEALALQTFYAQEMLKKGFLVGASVYSTFAYTPEIIKEFIAATREVFLQIRERLSRGGSIVHYLDGPIKHEGFKRLT
ncbi:aminotransferase class III-fold pyridoxal phosphate-dependent enzyme [Acidobacteria bacterium AH-259-O06]|nr:aminotransferase class III-fold pyridoxal phosphate-dependent enzyme [Acidobacteria bacterium AH-259-O06]